MGSGLYMGEPIYRRHVDRMCTTLEPMLGYDLRTQLFPTEQMEADPNFIPHFNSPVVTQPAIFVTELVFKVSPLRAVALLRLDHFRTCAR